MTGSADSSTNISRSHDVSRVWGTHTLENAIRRRRMLVLILSSSASQLRVWPDFRR